MMYQVVVSERVDGGISDEGAVYVENEDLTEQLYNKWGARSRSLRAINLVCRHERRRNSYRYRFEPKEVPDPAGDVVGKAAE